jgi:formylmethanofuran dehydrogenase subunit D
VAKKIIALLLIGILIYMYTINMSKYGETMMYPTEIIHGGGATVSYCSECDSRFVEILGDNMTGNLTVDGNINMTGNITTTGSGQFSYVDKLIATEPGTPPSDTLRLFVSNISGYPAYRYKDSLGIVRSFNDNELIVKNMRGTTIAQHRLVYQTGTSANLPTVDLARADSSSTMPVLCLTIEAITNGSVGRCITSGQIWNVNTNSVELGIIYISEATAGTPTNTAPITPNLTQEVGHILVKSATVGKIEIDIKELTGDEYGTAQNTFYIGNGTAGYKSLIFNDGSSVSITGKAGNVTVNSNLTVNGNITSDNVFLPTYIFSHTNMTISLTAASVWKNVTFAQEDTDIKYGITHTYNDATNHTFTISKTGIYNVDYDFDVEDTSPGASDINVAGRVIFIDGTEIPGSVFEIDITRQGAEIELSHNFLCELNAGDVIMFQFVADDADVQISTHGTFGDYPESASIVIHKIANI